MGAEVAGEALPENEGCQVRILLIPLISKASSGSRQCPRLLL